MIMLRALFRKKCSKKALLGKVQQKSTFRKSAAKKQPLTKVEPN
jgi:hypothetical protein